MYSGNLIKNKKNIKEFLMIFSFLQLKKSQYTLNGQAFVKHSTMCYDYVSIGICYNVNTYRTCALSKGKCLYISVRHYVKRHTNRSGLITVQCQGSPKAHSHKI